MKSHMTDFLEQSYSRRNVFTGVGKLGIAFSGIAAMGATGRHWGIPGGWATGGTAAMKGCYPDPFAGGTGPTCTLYTASALGPCHALTVDRKDVSEGQNGLPVRLAFLILDSQCQPIPGATIEIWHTAPNGLYSGSDAANVCTFEDPEATAARWFRGIQTADEKGRVDFDSCYPGWYSSRAVHIHFTVRANGKEYLTSQLFFKDALNTEIFTTHPVYKSRGDTTSKTDTDSIVKKLNDPILQTAKQFDGALLAWKALIVSA